MKKIELIPLNKINYRKEFWKGTKFRRYNVGLNVKDEQDNYFDYMLVYVGWEMYSLMLVNITENSYDAGFVYGSVIPVDESLDRMVVRVKDLKAVFGEESKDWYLIKESYE